MLQWLLGLVMLPALLGAGVALGESWFRSRGIPTRFLWAGAMIVSLAWPTLAVMSPRAADAVSETVAFLPPVVVDATGALTIAAAPLSQSVHRTAPVLFVLVLGCALFGIARLGAGWLKVRAERATWRRGTVDGCDVLVSHDRGPAVVGFADPQIVLPEWIVSSDAATRRIVLRHENEHRMANDVATLLTGRVLHAIIPWSPGIRWLAARLAVAIEHDCDMRVLRSGVGRPDYERALLAVADRIGTPRLAPSLAENPSYLERRITTMRTLDRRRSALAPLAGSAIALTAMYAVFVLPGTPSAVAQALPVPASASMPDTVYFEYQVDQPVGPDSMVAPRYPAEQRVANVEGEVLVQFVVDTTGSMELGSLKVLRTNHEDFTAAVRIALGTARFKPAMKDGQKVRQLVQMPFMFQLNR